MGNYECKKYGRSHYVKAGKVQGEQRFKCKDCGCQFVPTRQKGRSANTKTVALFLYVSGLSLRGIAKVVKANAHAVYRWILAYGRMNYEQRNHAAKRLRLNWMKCDTIGTPKNKSLDMEGLLP